MLPALGDAGGLGALLFLLLREVRRRARLECHRVVRVRLTARRAETVLVRPNTMPAKATDLNAGFAYGSEQSMWQERVQRYALALPKLWLMAVHAPGNCNCTGRIHTRPDRTTPCTKGTKEKR